MIKTTQQQIVDDAMISRHSMRAFLPTPVPREEIEKMFYHLESVIINKDIADYTHDDDFWDVTPYDEDLPF